MSTTKEQRVQQVEVQVGGFVLQENERRKVKRRKENEREGKIRRTKH